MYDNRSIGIFDSGLGGLTVAKEIYTQLPHESTIYLGDTARVPYGNRSPDTIKEFSRELTEHLIKHDVKAIVVACATASSVALEYLKAQFPNIPIVGVIESSCLDAINTTKTQKIGIIGTRATINSQSFDQRLHQLNPQIITFSKACPLFVPIVEEGIFDHQILNAAIDYYLTDFNQRDLDTIILGCTHYPLISDAISQYLKNAVQINVGVSVAKNLKQILETDQLSSSPGNPAKHEYFITDYTPNFSNIANKFLGKQVEAKHFTL